MRKLPVILGISLLVTALSLLLMQFVAIKTSAKAPCCDQFNLEASYGFPLPFRQEYSGGLSGQGQTTTKPSNVMVDGVVVFVASAAVLGAISMARERSRST